MTPLTQPTKHLIALLKSIASEKGITHEAIAQQSGLVKSNVTRALGGRYNISLDTFIRLCSAIGVRLELHYNTADTDAQTVRNADVPAFMLVPDADNRQLYLLHTKQPACLLHIVQTMPASISIVETYQPASPDALDEIMTMAMDYYRQVAGDFIDSKN